MGLRSPNYLLKPDAATRRRFLAKVTITPKCWEWTGTKIKFGYGRFGWGGKLFLSHRAAYMLFIGSINKKDILCHTCDNPSCVNPTHLYKGSLKSNMQDRMLRGRNPMVGRTGAKHHNSVAVTDLRSGITYGSQAEAARMLGINQSAISLMINGQSSHASGYRFERAQD